MASGGSVPIQGDKLYRDALANVARELGMTQAALVRGAVDSAHGERITKEVKRLRRVRKRAGITEGN